MAFILDFSICGICAVALWSLLWSFMWLCWGGC